MKKILIIISLVFVFKSAWADECLQNRVAFDIGSGTTKMVVATVDTCLQNVKQILEEKDISVEYQDDQDQSEGVCSEEIQKMGLKALKQLKESAQKYHPVEFSGVATSAFRKSKNGAMLAKRISDDLGIPVRIIPQRTEAILGFLAAYPQTGLKKKECLVWDIGAGSMQIVAVGEDDTFEVYEGKLASVSMKNMIIGAIQGKSYLNTNSPNPMEKAVANKAVNMAQYYAKIHIPDMIKEKAPFRTIFGIGGVHYYSIRKQSVKEGKTFTLSEVEAALAARQGLTDTEIGGKYATTEISNLTLVLGFMKELGIEKVMTVKANMAHGILIYPRFWN